METKVFEVPHSISYYIYTTHKIKETVLNQNHQKFIPESTL